MHRLLIPILLMWAGSATAEIYSYTNSDGDYVVTQNRPDDPNISYAVLTDEGDFIRMVRGSQQTDPHFSLAAVLSAKGTSSLRWARGGCGDPRTGACNQY